MLSFDSRSIAPQSTSFQHAPSGVRFSAVHCSSAPPSAHWSRVPLLLLQATRSAHVRLSRHIGGHHKRACCKRFVRAATIDPAGRWWIARLALPLMTYRKWLVGAVVLGVGVTAANRGCLHRKAPDEKLADHLAQTCRIARDNVDTPKRGVDELGRYLAKHTGEVMGDFGDLLTTIETIRDDREHDERALLASDRLREVTRPCRQTWLDFNDA